MSESPQELSVLPDTEAIRAVRDLFRKPIVLTDEFHQVYGQFLDSADADNSAIRELFDNALHNTGSPFDDGLLKEGKISPIGVAIRWDAPDTIDCNDDAAQAAWVAANMTLEEQMDR